MPFATGSLIFISPLIERSIYVDIRRSIFQIDDEEERILTLVARYRRIRRTYRRRENISTSPQALFTIGESIIFEVSFKVQHQV